MLPSDVCDDDCAPSWAKHSSISALAFSYLPLTVTFLVVKLLALHKLFPRISGLHPTHDDEGHYLPDDAPPSLRESHVHQIAKSPRGRMIAFSFSTTIALAAVFAELILCEISNALEPAARATALKLIVPTLLFFLVVLIPVLEIQSVISGCGWSFRRQKNKLPKLPWILQVAGFTIWLVGFWWIGRSSFMDAASDSEKGLSKACLERIGIIGISLVALLSGFAAVSAAWQTFGVRAKPVSEADVARKKAGLHVTNEMLAAKRSRLRVLRRKVFESPSEGFVTKVIGSIRGGGDVQEIKALELEITGLISMEQSLSSSLTLLENRLASTRRSTSPLGKLLFRPVSYGFALYCIFRILTTVIAGLRRAVSNTVGSAAFSASNADPINRILSLLAKYIYPALDQQAWSRQIAFLLSGIMLLASFNSVLQTFHMLTRLLPSLLYQAQTNLALIVAQISATYVISNALLLRSNLPIEMKSAVSEALGSPLEPAFVERWFDGWFLIATSGTALGIFLGRKVCGGDWDDLDDGDIEMGHKRH
ncbi:Abscisic acid G-protein coupled receptor-domain-containing protein [Calycina marina]|uniref:Abscisic acid G-protein coupled receptor-domain-containing protein n=1 Tax=Calycina marina TaxID=1763456 RepID=A0A9P7Z6P1_9HELO|nr:Abscisic acid G-protein coupled receptor-domain-containing protein [Calycina marina]